MAGCHALTDMQETATDWQDAMSLPQVAVGFKFLSNLVARKWKNGKDSFIFLTGLKRKSMLYIPRCPETEMNPSEGYCEWPETTKDVTATKMLNMLELIRHHFSMF